MRLAASKDLIVMNTATAMLTQMVTKVFERVIVENKNQQQLQNQSCAKQIDMDKLKTLSKEPPSWMNESAQDAYMLLQVNFFVKKINKFLLHKSDVICFIF
jgi:heme-binding NEAT domain protein